MRGVKAMSSLPLLVATACSGGGGTDTTSGPVAGGSSSAGQVVTSDAVSTSASTGDSTGTVTNGIATNGTAATGSSTTGTSAADAAQVATTTATTTAGASVTSDTTSGGLATTMGAVTGGTTASNQGDETLSFSRDIFPLWEMVREPAWQYRGTGSYSGCNVDGVCHGGASPGAGLMMADAPSTYAELIDVPSASTLCAGSLRVVAGDPEVSCLVSFYQGRLGNDDLGWVDDAEIELMREWIRQGALP